MVSWRRGSDQFFTSVWMDEDLRRKPRAGSRELELSMKTPILFCIFNRPDLTERVFAAIREAKPAKLYVVADGPRADRLGETALCEETRRVTEPIDWPCEVQRRYRSENLGCRRSMTDGIGWFFENEEEGIILEDDCLPAPDFFPFCAELLGRFRDAPRVAMISGFNGGPRPAWTPTRPRVTVIPHIWGWATWRRAWLVEDPTREDWKGFRDTEEFRRTIRFPAACDFWRSQMDRFFDEDVDTWDLPWVLGIWMRGDLSVSAGVNLIQNIGFDERGTHTRKANRIIADLGTGTVRFPQEAVALRPDRRWERCVYRHLFRLRVPASWLRERAGELRQFSRRFLGTTADR